MSDEQARFTALFRERSTQRSVRVDRMFAALMVVQWVVAAAFAWLFTPLAWAGRDAVIHAHVLAAVGLGGLITVVPVALALGRPGEKSTGVVIAIAQMLWSALLIHLTGGRIETHFHVFGSLALVGFYLDVSILAPATLVVALDHFLRGLLWPESVYGVLNPEWWRFLEHAGWMAFLDVFLVVNCLHGRKELMGSCRDRIAAEDRFRLEAEAKADSARADEQARAVGKLMLANTKLLEAQEQLADAARSLGIAEMASGILHNVGNVLNSVKTSAALMQARVDKPCALKLASVDKLLSDNADDLGALFGPGKRGARLPEYIARLTAEIERERAQNRSDANTILESVGHIEQIVAAQQSYARHGSMLGATTPLSLAAVVEEAIVLRLPESGGTGIEIVRRFEALDPVPTDRHAVLQVLVNFLANAEQAIAEHDGDAGLVEIGIERDGTAGICVWVRDTGVGWAPGGDARLFQYGFTTKANGNGFGLHASANTIHRLGGTIGAHSDGVGQGARFWFRLPVVDAAAA